MLGDFNRRLALPDDWPWAVLSPPAALLLLLTEGVPYRCDPSHPAFIDHLVAGGGAEAMPVDGSFREWPRRGPHPDHCAVSALIRMGRQARRTRWTRSSSNRVQPRRPKASSRRL